MPALKDSANLIEPEPIIVPARDGGFDSKVAIALESAPARASAVLGEKVTSYSSSDVNFNAAISSPADGCDCKLWWPAASRSPFRAHPRPALTIPPDDYRSSVPFMDSTLSVLDEAYDSGKRSRTSSFHSQRAGAEAAGRDVSEKAPLAQPQSHQQLHSQLHPNQQLDPALLYGRSHRRQISDTSEFDGISATSSPYPSATSLAHNSLQPDDASPLVLDLESPFSPSSNPNFDEQGLQEAFDASLFMGDRQEFLSGPGHKPQFQHQEHYISPMDRAYREMLRRSSFSSGQISKPYVQEQQDNMHLNPNYTLPFGAVPPSMSQSSSQISSPFDATGTHVDQGLSQSLGLGTAQVADVHQNPQFVSVNDGTDLHMSDVSQSYDLQPVPPGQGIQFDLSQPSQDHYPMDSRRFLQHSQSNSQLRLEVPNSDMFDPASIGIPASYTDASPYDCTSFGDQTSPSIDPLALSRSNSYTSQFQVPYDPHQLSAPASPYVLHDGYHSPVEQRGAALGAFNQTDMLQDQQQQAYLPQQAVAQPPFYIGQELQAGSGPTHSSYPAFGAPGIAIDPPTPSQSYLGVRQNPIAYPFPQQVPMITTTAAPDVQDETVNHLLGADLTVDRGRGRSNSDSRLNLHSRHARSGSNSSFDSFTTSRSSAGVVLGLDHRSSSQNRISKPGDQTRRASWSGVPQFIKEDSDDDAHEDDDPQQVGAKQKNPATFICPVEGCNKAFTRAYNLRSHQRTHTNERPFLCEICNKGFARQHDRKRHEKLHTNEKPFSCPGCLKKFARMDALSRHFKSETGKDCIVGNPEYQHYLDEMDE